MFGLAEGATGTRRLRDSIAVTSVPRRAVLTAIIVIEVIILYLLLDDGGWVYDDNLILALAGQSGLRWSWLVSPIFQHWGIGYHFVFSAVHRLMPIDYRWALAGMLGLLGGSIYLIDRIFGLLFRGRWISLIAAAYFGISVLFVRQLQWFASGLQAVPNTFFDLLCLYGYLRFVLDGSRRWVVVSAGALAAGFLFFEKPAYMLLYLLLLRTLFMSDDLHPRALARALWREWPVWGALIAVTAVWAVAYLHYAGSAALGAGSVSVSQYLRFFRILWAQTLIPALTNLTVPQAHLTVLQVAVAAVMQIVTVLAVVLSLRRKRSAWRAWLFLAVDVLVTGVLVARARVPRFGAGVGGDLRYLTDFAWLGPLAVCFAFARRSTLWPELDDRSAALTVRATPRLASAGAGVGAVALIAYVLAGVITTARLQREWAGHDARAWETRLRGGLARLEAGGRRVVVADDIGPFFIVEPGFAPYNLLSRIVPLYDPRAQVDGVLDAPLATVDPAGNVHPATVASRLDGGDVRSLLRSRRLSATGRIEVAEHPDRVCVTAGAGPASLTYRLVVTPLSAAATYYLRVTYSARRAAGLPLFVGSESSSHDMFAGVLSVARGNATSILRVTTPIPRRLRLSIASREMLCVSQLDLVTLRSVS